MAILALWSYGQYYPGRFDESVNARANKLTVLEAADGSHSSVVAAPSTQLELRLAPSLACNAHHPTG